MKMRQSMRRLLHKSRVRENGGLDWDTRMEVKYIDSGYI